MREAARNAVFGIALWLFVWSITDAAHTRPGCIEMRAYTTGSMSQYSTVYACTEVQPDLRRINAATFPDGVRRHLHTRPQ